MEHLDFNNEQDVIDPLDEELTNKISEIASNNTLIYRKIFACYPDDNIQKPSDVKDF